MTRLGTKPRCFVNTHPKTNKIFFHPPKYFEGLPDLEGFNLHLIFFCFSYVSVLETRVCRSPRFQLMSLINIAFIFCKILKDKKLLPWSNNTQLVHDFYFDTIIFGSDLVNVKFLFNCINLSGARSIHSSMIHSSIQSE